MIHKKYVYLALCGFMFLFQAWGASIPTYATIKKCKCIENGQAHFFKDLKNKSEIQILKGSCTCQGKKKNVTTICASHDQIPKALMACALDSSVTADQTVEETSPQPSTTSTPNNDSQNR